MAKNATQGYVDARNVSIKEHYDELLAQVCKTLDERFKAQEKAAILQEQINEKKFDSQNEWRGAMNDREKAYITRQDHDALIALLNAKEDMLKKDIKSLEITRATLDGKASQNQLNITFAFTFISLMLAIVGIIMGFYGH
jgi:hypothetical protein